MFISLFAMSFFAVRAIAIEDRICERQEGCRFVQGAGEKAKYFFCKTNDPIPDLTCQGLDANLDCIQQASNQEVEVFPEHNRYSAEQKGTDAIWRRLDFPSDGDKASACYDPDLGANLENSARLALNYLLRLEEFGDQVAVSGTEAQYSGIDKSEGVCNYSEKGGVCQAWNTKEFLFSFGRMPKYTSTLLSDAENQIIETLKLMHRDYPGWLARNARWKDLFKQILGLANYKRDDFYQEVKFRCRPVHDDVVGSNHF
jgi:hypothetical protein